MRVAADKSSVFYVFNAEEQTGLGIWAWSWGRDEKSAAQHPPGSPLPPLGKNLVNPASSIRMMPQQGGKKSTGAPTFL